MNTEDFVTHEQSVALKKLDFRENCLYFYTVDGYLTANKRYNDQDGVDANEMIWISGNILL